MFKVATNGSLNNMF